MKSAPAFTPIEVFLNTKARSWNRDRNRLRFFWLVGAIAHLVLFLSVALSSNTEQKKPLNLDVVLVNQEASLELFEASTMADRSSQGSGNDTKDEQFQRIQSPWNDPEALLSLRHSGATTAQDSPSKNAKLERAFDPKQMNVALSTFPDEYRIAQELSPQLLPKRESVVANNESFQKVQPTAQRPLGPVDVQQFKKNEMPASLKPRSQALRRDEAAYVYAWSRDVEIAGKQHYPKHPKTQKPLSGKVVLAVDLDPLGQVRWVRISESSGDEFLDAQAIQIVKMASPYAAFPVRMKERFSHIRITKPWYFYGEQKRLQ